MGLPGESGQERPLQGGGFWEEPEKTLVGEDESWKKSGSRKSPGGEECGSRKQPVEHSEGGDFIRKKQNLRLRVFVLLLFLLKAMNLRYER